MSDEFVRVGACARCKAPMMLPVDLYNAAKRSSAISFFCAYGHSQHFVEGPSEAEELRRERDRLKQSLAQRDDSIKYWREEAEGKERKLRAAKGQVTKIKKRAAAGVCPCCNRTFSNMAAHMRTQHPQFGCEEVDAA